MSELASESIGAVAAQPLPERSEGTRCATMISARLVEAVDAPAHEGPVWFPDEKTLYYTSLPLRGPDGVPQVRIESVLLDHCPLRELTGPVGAGRVRTVVHDANAANGMCSDGAGGLLVCEQGGPHPPARISRLDPLTGMRETVVAALDGRPLNSPNDITRHPDGSIWFTDPSYGWYQGFRPRPSIADGVHRYDPATGEHTLVTHAFDKPNGLAFAPDESLLYVVESRGPQTGIFVFDVVDGGRALGAGRQLIDAEGGTPDGFRVDVDGNLWCGWGQGPGADGVRVFNPDGRLIGRIDLPERCANVCFGGRWRNRLFMAASRSVYSLYVNTQGTI
jgi:gluconolactonase